MTAPPPAFTSVELSSSSALAYQFGPSATMTVTPRDQNGAAIALGAAVPVFHVSTPVATVNASNVVVVTDPTPTNITITVDVTLGAITHTSTGVALATDLAPTNETVNVVGTSFGASPFTVHIKKNGSVTWNGLNGGLLHNVDFGASGATPFSGGSSNVSGAIGAVNTAIGTFGATAGSFDYQCDNHGPAMHGTVVVH